MIASRRLISASVHLRIADLISSGDLADDTNDKNSTCCERGMYGKSDFGVAVARFTLSISAVVRLNNF